LLEDRINVLKGRGCHGSVFAEEGVVVLLVDFVLGELGVNEEFGEAGGGSCGKDELRLWNIKEHDILRNVAPALLSVLLVELSKDLEDHLILVDVRFLDAPEVDIEILNVI
jgi:hypothetical protein